MLYAAPYQTPAGCGHLAHLTERYFTRVENVMLTDQLLEAAMRTVIAQGPIALAHPRDYDARAELMWAAALAHNTLLQTGRVGDWASHKLDHELSALYDLAHGAGLAIVFPAWLKYVLPHGPAKLKQFAVQVLGVPEDCGDDEAVAREGICRLEAFYRSLNMPTRLRDAGIGQDRLEEMAARATSGVWGVPSLDLKPLGHLPPDGLLAAPVSQDLLPLPAGLRSSLCLPKAGGEGAFCSYPAFSEPFLRIGNNLHPWCVLFAMGVHKRRPMCPCEENIPADSGMPAAFDMPVHQPDPWALAGGVPDARRHPPVPTAVFKDTPIRG